MFRKMMTRLAAVALLAGAALNAQAADVSGAGATFVFPAMTRWSADYNRATQNRINYQSIGSGGGLAQARAGTVDFGSSDAPMSPAQLQQSGLGQFPSVIGGVVPVINVPGLTPGQLRLTGEVLADIYLGTIRTWNDPRIAELNPGIRMPALAIRPIYRSDGSGTTYNYVNYLSKVSPTWKQRVGEGTSVRWPTGIGGRGNEGVAAMVKQVRGAIGYVELSYALTNRLTYTGMRNAAGNWVQPNAETFAAAAASADWASAQDFSLVITNAPGAQAWPIAATNFILVSQRPRRPANAREAINFFRWVYANGDESARQLGYVPLPDELVRRIEAYWAQKFTF
jgi:phosphate transport system substrate-binding protein